MNITELINLIKQDENCEVRPVNNEIAFPTNIPDDLKEFYELTDGIKLFESEPYGITIVGREELIPTNNTYIQKTMLFGKNLKAKFVTNGI